MKIQSMTLTAALASAFDRNPKEHSIDDLVASFKRFGFVAAPTIDEATKVMVAGHGRCAALKKMKDENPTAPPKGIEIGPGGEWMVPVIRGVSFASEKERNAFIIADNQQVIAGGWKFDTLAELLGELRDDAGGFDGLGFEEIELNSLLGRYDEEVPSAGTDPEATPAPPAPSSSSAQGHSQPDDSSRGRVEITARVECPKCGHMIER